VIYSAWAYSTQDIQGGIVIPGLHGRTVKRRAYLTNMTFTVSPGITATRVQL
jgi:hypothetical protein